MKLVPGLYESLLTKAVNDATSPDQAEIEPISPDGAPHVLGRYLTDALVRALRNLPEENRAAHQVQVANQLLDLLRAASPNAGLDHDDAILDPARMLLAVRELSDNRLATPRLERPSLPLRHSDLLVNGPRDLRIGPEIRKELASSDAVDVLVSFVKWNGVRLIRRELEEFCRRRPGQLRVVTTTYMGATEPEALDLLRDLGADIRVSYDARRTRLHAKAWLFHRHSGFSTALIGSSNLSPAAMLDGCEWNVRLSVVDNRIILEKFLTTFRQYWEDTESFEPYDKARFAQATRRKDDARDALVDAVNLRPLPHQQAALDALETERRHGHWKNLIVAATGTGKTIVAALDYARLRQQLGGDPSLLFVAHSEEILKQSLARYRLATRDGNFGELHVGQERAAVSRHVFASIQSLHQRALEKLRPDAYDVLVIDEFHHAAASSYEALLEHLTPKVLLGLTATPERADGRPILHWFDHRVAAELRLWDAIDRNLLAPFQYFGVHDGTDFSNVDFRNGRYDLTALSKILSADDARALAVLRAIERHILNPKRMRALGFCVSVAHARFMAAFFSKHGLPAVAVDAETSDADRSAAIDRLRRGEVNTVFAVNLFNEGVDVPSVDTVLFLRPTESATLFLQQLGRGLRLEEGKTCLTVLDFIGNAHRKFSFVERFRALSRGTRVQVEQAVEDGFPHLPTGCDIRLDAQSQKIVLANIRASLTKTWKNLAADLRSSGAGTVKAFLEVTQLELEDLYSNPGRTFTALRHDAGLRINPLPENALTRAFARLLHVDDDDRLSRWATWLSLGEPPIAEATDPFMLMLFVALGQSTRPVTELMTALNEVWAEPELRQELRQVVELLADRQRRPTFPLRGAPFQVHATYSRDEIAAGLGELRKGKLLRTQAGVFKSDRAKADVLYVELDKDPRHYTPTTLYDDRPLSPTLFQWESQAVTRADSETGLRYQKPPMGWRTLLFVRQRAEVRPGITSPYLFLGPVSYVSHEGEKPMRIVWKLERAMPPDFFSEVKIAAS